MYREGVGVSRSSCGARKIRVCRSALCVRLHERGCCLEIRANTCSPFTFHARSLDHGEG